MKYKILFITPIKHLTEFYSYVLQNYESDGIGRTNIRRCEKCQIRQL